MAVSRVHRHTELIWDGPGWRRKRPRQWLPSREKYYFFTRAGHTWLLHWKPFNGIWLLAELTGGPAGQSHTLTPRPEKKMPVKRRPGSSGSPVGVPEAKQTSTILAKLPALREWMVATTYDDGSLRMPGKLSVDIYGTAWSVMLRDPNNGLRLSVRGEDLDKTLLTLEQLLGVEEAPWERDQRLTDQIAKKGKKK